jgi:hypothetical protein
MRCKLYLIHLLYCRQTFLFGPKQQYSTSRNYNVPLICKNTLRPTFCVNCFVTSSLSLPLQKSVVSLLISQVSSESNSSHMEIWAFVIGFACHSDIVFCGCWGVGIGFLSNNPNMHTTKEEMRISLFRLQCRAVQSKHWVHSQRPFGLYYSQEMSYK